MKFLLTTIVLAFSFGYVGAQEKKKFFLEDDGSVTQRVEKVESKMAALEAEVVALKKQVQALRDTKTIAQTGPSTIGSSPKTFPLTPVPQSNPQYKVVRVQVCTNGVCRYEDQLVPVQSTATAGNPCPQGQCIDCQCPNAGVCASGACNSGFSMGTTSSGGSCASGSCNSNSNSGWYLGKNLRRR